MGDLTSPTAARLSRPLFLWATAAACLLLPLEWFADVHPLIRYSIPVREVVLVGIGIAVWQRMLDQRTAEQTLFWFGLVATVMRMVTIAFVDPLQAVLEVAISAPVMIALAAVLAPRASRPVWISGALAAHLVPGAIVIAPRAPQMFGRVALFLAITCLILAVLDRQTRLTEATSDLAYADELTGLCNRRAMQSAVEAALSHPGEGSVGMLMIDLDHFKALNDDKGHEAGDEALQRVAGALRSALPPAAVVGRWGGEEFLAIVPGLVHRDLLDLAEHLRERIAADSSVTASIGVSVMAIADSPGSWVRRTDVALYRAKEAGRDRVSFAAEQLDLSLSLDLRSVSDRA